MKPPVPLIYANKMVFFKRKRAPFLSRHWLFEITSELTKERKRKMKRIREQEGRKRRQAR
jgi:hypothetical protein